MDPEHAYDATAHCRQLYAENLWLRELLTRVARDLELHGTVDLPGQWGAYYGDGAYRLCVDGTIEAKLRGEAVEVGSFRTAAGAILGYGERVWRLTATTRGKP